jgi:hypothetical protein
MDHSDNYYQRVRYLSVLALFFEYIKWFRHAVFWRLSNISVAGSWYDSVQNCAIIILRWGLCTIAGTLQVTIPLATCTLRQNTKFKSSKTSFTHSRTYFHSNVCVEAFNQLLTACTVVQSGSKMRARGNLKENQQKEVSLCRMLAGTGRGLLWLELMIATLSNAESQSLRLFD